MGAIVWTHSPLHNCKGSVKAGGMVTHNQYSQIMAWFLHEFLMPIEMGGSFS